MCLPLLLPVLLLQLLRVGYVACSPPVPTVSESDLKQVDIQEGYQVDLAPGSALPCVVSFAPGQERRVYFAGVIHVGGAGWGGLLFSALGYAFEQRPAMGVRCQLAASLLV
jgi:hypothetical protein